MEPPAGKRFYGSVTVSERGQIVIPVDARADFGIKAGDKLLVLGDLKQGLAFITFPLMQRTMRGTTGFFHEVGRVMQPVVDKKDVSPPRRGRRTGPGNEGGTK